MESTSELKENESIHYCLGHKDDFKCRTGTIEKIVDGEMLKITGEIDLINIQYVEKIVVDPEPVIMPLKENYPLAHLMAKEALDALGFKLMEFNGQYGKAKSKKFGGKAQLTYNLEGAKVGYGGEKLPPNFFLCIKEDWGTRTVFNGIVRSHDDLITVLGMTIN